MPIEEKLAPMIGELAGILARARDQHELQCLLQGMLTPSELEEIQLRWHLLRELAAGVPQREISRKLGISLGKITRGSRLLKYGDNEFVAVARRIMAEMAEEKRDHA